MEPPMDTVYQEGPFIMRASGLVEEKRGQPTKFRIDFYLFGEA
jgi:hypothetical protein